LRGEASEPIRGSGHQDAAHGFTSTGAVGRLA
jgi:hypothetical protein